MINELIGEREIEINGVVYYMTPSFHALTQIEKVCDKGVHLIFEDLVVETPRVTDIAAILWCCHMAHAESKEITYLEFGKQLCQHGAFDLLGETIELLQYALAGGKKKEDTVNQGLENLLPA